VTSSNAPITQALEWLWLAIAIAGVVVQMWLMRDSLRTKHAAELDPRGNGRRGRLIRGHLRTSFHLLGVHLIFTFFGIRALTLPNAPITVEGAFYIMLFILGSVLLVAIGIGDRRDRLWIRNYPGQRDRATDEGGQQP
jgi:hypothetical protein